MPAEVGKSFPSFSLQNQDGHTVTLDDFKGKWLVLYVYPKDDTPGCTIQGKSFTATKQEFDDANIAVVGVSEDDVESHKNFCNKFSFTIDLLADPNHNLLRAAGVARRERQRRGPRRAASVRRLKKGRCESGHPQLIECASRRHRRLRSRAR